MMRDLSTPLLFLAFFAAAAIVWKAGKPLADTTETLSRHYGLGEALGGMLILAIVTDLPELAIVASAALRGDLSLAVGNLLGGTAAQMIVLVALDRARPELPPLVTRAASPTLVVECLLVIALLGLVVAGPMLADIGTVGKLALPDLLAPALWIGGLLWIGRLRPAAGGRSTTRQSVPISRGTFAVFGLAALATFAGGVGLEVFGEALAARFDIGGVVFGATVLAAATSLPELSTGWASAKAGENELAVSDILGGNAVLPVLLTVASLCAGASAYAAIDGTSLYLSAVGIVMTAIYAAALILRPKRRVLGLGPECVLLLAVYAVALIGLA